MLPVNTTYTSPEGPGIYGNRGSADHQLWVGLALRVNPSLSEGSSWQLSIVVGR